MDYLPNPELTPGRAASADVNEVCVKDYTMMARHVTNGTKNKVYTLYGVSKDGKKIDHLVPLSIGGANTIDNLWPHAYQAEYSVFEKTRLEVKLRKVVCNEHYPILEAQECIRTNWVECFNKFFPNDHERRIKKWEN